MPAASAHTWDETEDAEWLSEQIRPINLVDIGRVLGESAKAERLGDIPIRAWREDLTVIRDALSYARAILAADVAILTESGSSPQTGQQGIVDELPGVLAPSVPETPVAATRTCCWASKWTSTRVFSCAPIISWRPTGRWPGWT